jgi:hypothetical protein
MLLACSALLENKGEREADWPTLILGLDIILRFLLPEQEEAYHTYDRYRHHS